MRTLTVRQILLLHEFQIDKYGGGSGVRDIKILESAVFRPFATFAGNDLYPDIFLKAGALIQSLVGNHPFVDGNKRTAFISAVIFLEINGICIKIPQKEVVQFMLSVTNDGLSVDEIAFWLKKHFRKN